MTYPKRLNRKTRQRGSALIIALVFLLLMTLIGVTAMQTTTLQERMAGNMRDRNLALQAAEAALLQGEIWAQANINAILSADPIEVPREWDGVSNPPANGTVAVDAAQLSANPVFHVGPPRLINVSNELGRKPVFQCIYTVTARAQGGSQDAVVILQVGYQPLGYSCG